MGAGLTLFILIAWRVVARDEYALANKVLARFRLQRRHEPYPGYFEGLKRSLIASPPQTNSSSQHQAR